MMDEETNNSIAARIIQDNRLANRSELELLYRRFVCEDMTQDGLDIMRDGELRRYVAIGMFTKYQTRYTHNRRIIRVVCNTVGVSESAVYEWIKQNRAPMID